MKTREVVFLLFYLIIISFSSVLYKYICMVYNAPDKFRVIVVHGMADEVAESIFNQFQNDKSLKAEMTKRLKFISVTF